MELTAEEIRVLGVLVEKEATTPEQYPLSTNALTTACNQKTSREPVVSYDQRTVSQTMLLLRPAGLARTVISGRTEKHRHVLHEAWNLDHAELAVLAVLMLRGAQSPGELRSRTERAHGFASLDEVHDVLDSLAARDEPLVGNIGRGRPETVELLEPYVSHTNELLRSHAVWAARRCGLDSLAATRKGGRIEWHLQMWQSGMRNRA